MNHSLVLGIDPGFDRIGWAIGSGKTGQIILTTCDCIITQRSESLPQRYQYLSEELDKIIDQYQPTHLAIEQLYFARNTTTALQVSEARGVILSSAIRHQLSIAEYHPNTIKLAVTGVGNATKAQVEKMVRLQVKLPQVKLIDDTIDAIAILMTDLLTRR